MRQIESDIINDDRIVEERSADAVNEERARGEVAIRQAQEELDELLKTRREQSALREKYDFCSSFLLPVLRAVCVAHECAPTLLCI